MTASMPILFIPLALLLIPDLLNGRRLTAMDHGVSTLISDAPSCNPCDHHTGADDEIDIGADDEIWIASSRSLGCAESGQSPKLRFWRRDGDGCWEVSDQTTFLAGDDPSIPTRVWTHGNRIGFQEAIDIGLLAHRGLAATEPGRMRFVIWSWPSERSRGPFRDVRSKAARTISEGYYLAHLVSQMNDDAAVHLIGYSFGSRVISGALHILGGGNLSGLALAKRPTSKQHLRAVLFAAAINDDWLLSDGYHGRALDAVEKLLATINRCDPTLRWYHLIEKRCRPRALGREGQMSRSALGKKYHEADVTNAIGRVHDWQVYLNSPTAMAYARGLFEVPEKTVAPNRDKTAEPSRAR